MTAQHGIRLAVLDDGLFMRTKTGDVRPLSATFSRFVETVAGTGAFDRVRYIIPVRDQKTHEAASTLAPVDQSVLEIVPTAYFEGIADYVLRSAYLVARNWPVIDRAIADCDLLWLRLPASNALLAMAAARHHRVPQFGWLAGSVGSVVRAQRRPAPVRWGAEVVGGLYDAVSRLAGRRGPLIELDADLFSSTVSAAELAGTLSRGAPRDEGRWRIVWAGRMAGEKGLPELIGAVQHLREAGRDITLVLVGDGPARGEIQDLLGGLPADQLEDHGYIGDRSAYMDVLRSGHVLVHPSRAEGVPKVLVEAMAAGLPIVAVDAGAVRSVLGDGERGVVTPAGNAAALAQTISELLDDAARRAVLRERGLAWAADHTAEAQAERLVSRLQELFPGLAWRAPVAG